MKKIAFCFLLTNFVKFPELWEEFFKRNSKHYTIYSHIKDINSPNIPDYIKNRAVKSVKTAWCGVSLINAYINMLKEAIKDEDNHFFVLLSGDCVPLYTFKSMREILTQDGKARLDVIRLKKPETGYYYYASQWNVLTRKVAVDYINMKKYYRALEYTTDYGHCPDELYPVYYFKKLYKKDFGKYIVSKVVNYTEWEEGAEHPVMFDEQNFNKRRACNSGALLARKFTNAKAARIVFKKCRRSRKK